MLLPRPSFRRSLATGMACAVAAGLAACGGGGAGDGRLVVAATAPQLDALLVELAGPGIDVAPVVAATADVHDIELRPSQVRALKQAELVLRPGRGNDAWAQEALAQVHAKQLDLSAGLPGAQRHWWMDPSFAESAARRIAAALDRLDPGGRADRAQRLSGVVQTLRAVDAATKRCLATVPAAGRLIVTDHDAAGAYAERYGLTVVGTISPGAEPEAAPSAQRVAQLERTMLARHAAAVFPIAPHGSELSSTVAQRGGARLGQPLWADALPSPAQAGSGNRPATLADAARLNGRSVAAALGADQAACGALR